MFLLHNICTLCDFSYLPLANCWWKMKLCVTFSGHNTMGSVSYYHNCLILSLPKCWCRRGRHDNMTELGNTDVPSCKQGHLSCCGHMQCAEGGSCLRLQCILPRWHPSWSGGPMQLLFRDMVSVSWHMRCRKSKPSWLHLLDHTRQQKKCSSVCSVCHWKPSPQGRRM